MPLLRFGPFELDSASRELCRNGVRMFLRPQPCAVLVYLAERPGRFVSRAELHRHLWGEHTHVDYDQGLNSCIKQVRHALGDSRSHPDYLETLPRRGYRFVKPVEIVEDDPSAATAPMLDSGLIAAIVRSVTRELASSVVAPPGRSLRRENA